ncbi:MAG: hypothetical protein E7112_06190 [Bacteroidales bacterium]|nr:hypothetical protein [Bacteroidales bacterium]
MRFIKNLYRSALAAVAGVLALTGCQPEESPLSRAILTSVSGMQFAAQNAEPQTITVYADADWTVEAPEWVTVDVTSGSRTMDVTVSVADNLRDGALDNPKKDTIIFRGYNLLSNAYVIVSQDGDKYRDVPATDISGILSMKDEDVVILDETQVVAVSSKGFVVSDGAASVFVLSSETVAVGDKVNVKGSKGTLNELAAVTICDEVEIVGDAAVTYPATSDITASLDAYAATKMEYVEVTGTLDGANVVVEGAAKVAAVLDATADFNLSSLNGHNVTINGYSAGVTASLVNVIVTEIVDLGVDEIIYYSDNFEWISPMALADGAGDAVGTNDPTANALNVWKMASSADFFAKFNEIGYQYLYSTVGMTEFQPGPAQEPNSSVGKDGSLYIQSNYLKFGQTSYSGALVLPALTAIQGAANIQIEFDWCWHVTGGYKPDIMTLSVDATVGQFADTAAPTSAALESSQSTVDGESAIQWQHVCIILDGATAETVLTIRPTNADPDVQNAARHQNRWYLDNIKITDAGGAVVTPPAGGSRTLAVFPFPNDPEFTGTGEGAGTKWNLEEGWLLSEDGKSRLSAHEIPKALTYKYEARNPEKDAEGTKDHVRVLATGMPVGGYWLFTVPVKDMPAGTYNITYNHSASATGPNYFLMEVSVDGQNWVPAGAQTTTETFKDGSNGREVTWTYALNQGGANAANVACTVDVDYTAPALPGENTLYVRAKIADDMAYGATKAMGGSGTNRIWGPCEITFTE